MNTHLVVLVACLGGIVACAATSQAPAQRPSAPPPVVVGSDKDAFGCKASAGYTWCAREQACVRPWELARRRGFDVNDEGFTRYCDSLPAQ